MTSPALFIGVVSYVGTRFAVSQGPDGLAAGLARSLEAEGLEVAVQINTSNLHDPRSLPVTPELVQASLTAQQRLEDEWVGFLRADRTTTIADRARSALRWGRRQWRRIHSPGPGPVTRLINIELSHVDLLRTGVASGAPWILIAEDDAATRDLADCSGGLRVLLSDTPASVQFINISESFPLADLGIEHLLTESDGYWAGTESRRILSSSRPVTNTVCAILYRTQFAQDLLAWLDEQPMTPVVPIDWKLNQALMDMYGNGRLPSGSCWMVSPAPIDQLSMRSEALQ